MSQEPDPSPAEVERLLAAEIPGEFIAATLSVYDMDAFPMANLRWRGYLR